LNKIPHIPVLFNETINCFKDIKSGYIIDCTLGYGGHTQGILENNPNIKMICNDQDDEALFFSQKRLNLLSDRIVFNKGNFQDVIESFKEKEISGILADIGVSSLQLDKESRGFGFDSEVLDMRMDQTNPFSASDIVNSYSQNQLENIIKNYGEFKEYKKAAALIVQNRPFSSAKELSLMFEKNFKRGKIHPATLPFQAIRIEVNKELEVLEELFKSIERSNLKQTIIAIISFHSLEDRIVKNYFKKWATKCICPSHFMKCECGGNNQLGKIITKKPIIPSDEEIKTNPRSRSSKLRVFKFD
jgi:16S rRNA (cytosine1402-N4)-methyltransferase